MINEKSKKQITGIWDNYANSNMFVSDTRGNVLNNIDDDRRKAIVEINELISGFLNGTLNVYEFKTSLDGYNKRNNFWGFTATKGQMFFNQLVKNNEQSIDKPAKRIDYRTQGLKRCT